MQNHLIHEPKSVRRHRPLLVCWDYDGLIVDTEWVEFISWRDALSKRGLSLALDEYQALAGTRQTGQRVLDLVVKRGYTGTTCSIVEEFRLSYHKGISLLQPRDGLCALLEQSHSRGLLNWVVSSSDKSPIAATLDRLGLLKFFDGIIGGDAVRSHKPSPEPYLAVLAETDTKAMAARVLEDSLVGVEAAQAAGIPVMAVVNDVTAQSPFPPDVPVVTSLNDVPLAWLLGEK